MPPVPEALEEPPALDEPDEPELELVPVLCVPEVLPPVLCEEELLAKEAPELFFAPAAAELALPPLCEEEPLLLPEEAGLAASSTPPF